MERERVVSSNVHSIGYDPEQKILEIEFNDRSTYHYFDVPELEHSKLMTAASKGKYLNSHIKGKYRYRQIK
ncbi:MAG: KTSC domain-containing protein [Thaumarchaeota archaeon]|nr:KTSC domain-containing protein [Nitrososphaerota archaeon]